jgi:hypothetical protein
MPFCQIVESLLSKVMDEFESRAITVQQEMVRQPHHISVNTVQNNIFLCVWVMHARIHIYTQNLI